MTVARVVTIRQIGAPEVMQIEETSLTEPAENEVHLRQTAIGFNYLDVYQRQGSVPIALPSGLGYEAAGVVSKIGAGVSQFKPGDRVAYMNAGIGAYTDFRNVSAERLVSIPDHISDEQAASLLFKGLTAQYLVRKTYRVKAGDIVLVHAAAGGVGQILCQWSKALGAVVIGTAGSDEKCEFVRRSGADIAVNYRQEDWPAQLLKATQGKKANVVYDSVGRDTFLNSLDCAAQFGTVVVFGAASGSAPPVDPEVLNKKGCLFLTRPSVFPHNSDVTVFRENAEELFQAIENGWVKATVGARFSLNEIASAHRAAESREVHGAIVITP